MYARDVLSRPVVTVRPETPLPHAIKLLTEHGFAALPVIDEHDQVIGMLSESDVLAAQTDQYRATVQTAMTVPAEVVQPVTEVGAIAQRMLTGHLRSMPVVEAGVLVGIIARRDLLRALIRDGTGGPATVGMAAPACRRNDRITPNLGAHDSAPPVLSYRSGTARCTARDRCLPGKSPVTR